MEHEWSDERYVSMAKREPDRLAFWLQYFPDELEASQCVCDNPPSFDDYWRREMGTPEQLRKRPQNTKVAGFTSGNSGSLQ
ncbi:MAG: hypothetical protein EHM66_00505 [Deltaproteobacteria bacterium]|nr:MAG: hypothetical protein EHM66_00505 [Deltaproteobacteria bacterium]